MSWTKKNEHKCSECGQMHGGVGYERCDVCGKEDRTLPVTLDLRSCYPDVDYSVQHACSVDCLKVLLRDMAVSINASEVLQIEIEGEFPSIIQNISRQ